MGLLDQVINEMRQVKFAKKKAKSSTSFKKIGKKGRSLKEGAVKEIITQAYDNWINSEDAPADDEYGDDNAMLRKALSHLQSADYRNIPPENKVDVAQAMVDMAYDMEGLEGSSPNDPFGSDDNDVWGEAHSTFGKTLMEKRKAKKPSVKKVKFGSGMAKGVKRKMFEADVNGAVTPQEDASIERLANNVAMQIVKDAEQFLRHVYRMEQEEFGETTEADFLTDNIADHTEFYVEQFVKDLQKRVSSLVQKQWGQQNPNENNGL